MSEEKNKVENEKLPETKQKYAIAGASAFIFNGQGELLLVRSPKWNNLWVVPGGKIEFGESMENALQREILEETNLIINDIKYLTTTELKNTDERPDLHLVVNEFIALAKNDDIKLNDEHSEYDWREPAEWLKDKDLYPNIREIIEYYLNVYSAAEDLENKYKRALADYQNLIKQTAKEKQEFAKYANENLLCEIIPVYENLKIALSHAGEENSDSWREGVKHIVKQFKDILNGLDVEEIKTAGQNFDHNFMEAVGEELTEVKDLDGTIAKEVKTGYKLHGKVIIPARVIVYKIKN